MTTVVQAEQQLAAARAAEAIQKRENAKQQIERLSAEGAALIKQLRPMAQQVREAQNERLKLHGLLVQAREQIEIYNTPLDPLTFPSAQDERERVRQLAAWRERQRELLAQHAAASEREAIRAQAVQIQRRLENITFEMNTLAVIAEGLKPGEFEGGLFRVGEDFIGHGPFVRPQS